MSKLVKCKTCKKEVDDSAKSCPHCGVSDPGLHYGIGCLVLIIFVVVVVAVVGFFLSLGDDEPKKPLTQKEKIEKNQFSVWDGSHMKLVQYIKENMNDPDSFEHIETLYGVGDTHINLTMKFRGKNAFGGTVLNTAKATADLDTGEILTVEILE